VHEGIDLRKREKALSTCGSAVETRSRLGFE
jgi:hypothetical protein